MSSYITLYNNIVNFSSNVYVLTDNKEFFNFLVILKSDINTYESTLYMYQTIDIKCKMKVVNGINVYNKKHFWCKIIN